MLNNSVRVIDLETGEGLYDVCEIGWQDFSLGADGRWEVTEKRGAFLVNPGRTISADTMAGRLLKGDFRRGFGRGRQSNASGYLEGALAANRHANAEINIGRPDGKTGAESGLVSALPELSPRAAPTSAGIMGSARLLHARSLARAYLRDLSDAELNVIEDAGHWLLEKHLDLALPPVRGFLSRNLT